MNKEYILTRIKPYLNKDGMLSENDFEKLFSRFNKHEQYEIVDILIEANIEIYYDDNEDINSKDLNENSSLKSKRNNNYNSYDYKKIQKLSNEQLCILYKKGYNVALEALINKNERLIMSRVLKFAKRYNHKLDIEDLFQYGMLGIITAAEKFELERGTKFVTYAINWIDQRIIRAIIDYGFTIRLPVHVFEKVNFLYRILIQNHNSTKEEILEIAENNGINREKFEEIYIIAKNIMSPASLNVLIGEESDSELVDFLPDNFSLTLEEEVESKILKEEIEKVLNTLAEREKEILTYRFGLKNGIEMTLEQIGRIYGVTRERIRQIEVKALRKLRHPSRSNKLKDF